jgi:hypothetical protein
MKFMCGLSLNLSGGVLNHTHSDARHEWAKVPAGLTGRSHGGAGGRRAAAERDGGGRVRAIDLY